MFYAAKYLRIKTFGIVGYVQSEDNVPIRDAVVAITGVERQYRVTKNAAHFHLLLPPGEYKVIIRAHNYHDQLLTWVVVDGVLKRKDVIMHRENTDSLPGGEFAELPVEADPNTLYITGLILDRSSSPLGGALVSARAPAGAGGVFRNTSDAAGRFALALPLRYKGREVAVSARADGYISRERHVTLNSLDNLTPNVLFKLEGDDFVLGMPRLVFVMLSGVVGVALVVSGAWCFSCRRRVRDSRREYLFTQIPCDDKRPLADDPSYEIVRKPYYDEDNIPSETSDSEDEILLLRSGHREWKTADQE